MFHKIENGFACDWFDVEMGRCKHYDDRPYFCRNFMCNVGKTWIEILKYGNDYY